MVEAKRLAFEDWRKLLRRPRLRDDARRRLISDDYAAERRALIDMKRANPNVAARRRRPPQGDTTYLTIADKDGMMVSLIQSNYRGMGSGLVADGLGFMFQDRGELFALDPRPPQRLRAGQAAVPDHHPRLRDEGRQALDVASA